MSNRFLLDENISFLIEDFLKRKGFVVYHIKKLGKTGIKNGEVYKLAEPDKCWIITRDTDFLSQDKLKKYKVGGVIVFRLKESVTKNLLQALKTILSDNKKYALTEKKIYIVMEEGIREVK